MKRTFKLIAAIALLVFMMPSLAGWGQTYTLATSISEGDVVLLINNDVTKELNGFVTTGTAHGSVSDVSNQTPVGLCPLIVVTGSTSGSFAFKTPDNKYISWSSGNTLVEENSITNNSSWNVSISQYGIHAATINNVAGTKRQIKYNSGSPRFACYESGQQTILLYKQSGPTQLSTPTNFTATPSNGEATFTWDAVENASSYTISYTPDGGDEVEFENAISPQVISMTNDIEYTCKIKAVGDGSSYSDSEYSSTITVAPTDATFYAINITSPITGGSVTASPLSAIEGATVTLTATPFDAYTFDNIASNWTISPSVTVTPGENNTATFEMPASDVSVSATFNAKPTFAVTCVADPVAGGSIVASPASAYEGQTVTLSCTTNTGYSLTEVVITKTSGGSATDITIATSGDNYIFEMPGYPVTVTATYKTVYVSGGSFQKFTGDLEEGYYVITYNTYTMKNTISSSRFTNGASITNGANIIEDIDKNIVWYIAKDGNYWTLYNEAVGKFAAGTNTQNQGALVDDVADLARWIVTKDNNGNFEFENYGRTNQTNKWLHNNTSNGWACYGSGTGGAVTLYKYFNANRQLSSIAVSGQTTDYIVGDAFSFDGVCTATYDDESTGVVIPTSVSTPDMTTAGSKTITVTYTEKEITKTTTYSISVIENPYNTTTLEGTDMAAMTDAGSGYYTIKSVETSDGFVWETNGYQTTNMTNMIQLKSRTDSGGVSYIKLPEVDGAIKKLTFAVTGSSASDPSGLTTSNKLYFQQSNTKNENIIAEGGGSNTNEIVIDLINKFYSKGYITASGSLRVWSISMEYIPYSDLEGTTLNAVENNSAIAIPANVSATASNITIPVNSGIVVRSGATLTVSGTLTNNAPANLIIEDGGQLITYSTGVQATVEKDITGAGAENWAAASGADGWYFIASPIDNADFNTAATGDYDLYMLDWANDQLWRNFKDSNNSSLFGNGFQRGMGYLYASKANNTLELAGEIKPLTAADTAKVILASDGWNLIGNPLTCKAIVDCNFDELNGAASVTSKTSDNAINPCQGIAVYGTKDQVVTFTKATSQNAAAPSNSAIQMTVAQNVVTRGNTSSTIVDNAVISLDGSSQLPKFNMLEGNAKLYIPQGNEEYAIVSAEAQGEMPVNFKAAVNGEYTITVNPEDVEMTYLHLIDNLTGADVDLLTTPSYTFSAKNDDYASRFRLVFSANNFSANADSDDFAFISNGQIIINGNTSNATLQTVDMLGRVVNTQQVNGNTALMAPVANGVYVLRLVNGSDVKTQKIVVR